MPCSSARLWSGAKTETLSMADLTSGVTTAGKKYCGPPCTTRCPTTSISEGLEIACVSPLHKLSSKRSMASPREPADGRTSFREAPREFLIEDSALPSAHSILPPQIQSGGSSGSVSPISYRQLFWLLEPELRTRTFISKATSSPEFPASRLLVRGCIAYARPVCCAVVA